ncbi:MAG TPA: FAD-dependent oxidoreductase [Pseudoclavibacter sp.]|nr:FAD-dependent oxidoreductase [Pseudoclavibacter sp.]
MAHLTAFERNCPHPSVVDHALANTRQSVYWLENEPQTNYPSVQGESWVDLVIVGGGFHGLWTAIRAKERHPELSVSVVEAHQVGWAASGRNGGFVEASLTHGESNGLQRWPEEMPTLERLGAENLQGIEDTIAKYHMNVDFERTGSLDVATEEYQLDWIRDEEGYLDAQQVRAEVNSPLYLGGLWHRDTTALVNPAKLAHELARVATELGVSIYEHSLVRRIDTAGSHVEVVTDDGVITGDHAVLATNVFPSLLRRNRLMTVPVYDYVLMTEPLSAEQLDSIGWAHRQGLSDLGNQFHYYRLTADNRILFGGYDAVYFPGRKVRAEHENRPASHQRLAAHFFATFPQLEGLTFTNKWAGAIDTCSRFCAFFGTAREGRVAYAAGFTGLGVAATRFAADVCLDLLDGEQTERTGLRMVREKPVPFPPEPFATGGIQVTRWALNRADHNKGRRNVLLKTLDALGMGFDS